MRNPFFAFFRHLRNSPNGEQQTAAAVATPETSPMNQFESILLGILGAAYTLNKEQLDRYADVAADTVVSAVKNSETMIDDAAADVVAKTFRRIADRIDAGISSAVDQA